MQNMDTVIVYFSKDNNTRTGAQLLSEMTRAHIIELKESKKGNFIQALRKTGSILQGDPWSGIKDAQTIFLMLPIWASNGVPAMNTFLEKADFHGKTVNIVTFQQFEDLRGSKNVHRRIKSLVETKNGVVKNCYALLGGKMGHCATVEFIQTQIDKIALI